MELTKLSNSHLIQRTEYAVKVERASTAEVVRHLQEIQRRRLFLEAGYPTLFEMVTKHFGYCAGSAMRRINSMRLMTDLPEVGEMIESGSLSLTTAATVQSFLHREAKDYTREEKVELVKVCLNKSTREVERELTLRNPEREKREVVRQVSRKRVRVSISISDELFAKLEKLKAILAHSNPSLSLEGVVATLAEIGLEKLDPMEKAMRSERRRTKSGDMMLTKAESDEMKLPKAGLGNMMSDDRDSQSTNPLSAQSDHLMFSDLQTTDHQASRKLFKDAGIINITNLSCDLREVFPAPEVVDVSESGRSEIDRPLGAGQIAHPTQLTDHSRVSKRSRYIPAAVKNWVILNNAGRGCNFVDAVSGRRCGSKHFLQVDHIEAFSDGGPNTLENLQLLCGPHNRMKWDQSRSASLKSIVIKPAPSCL